MFKYIYIYIYYDYRLLPSPSPSLTLKSNVKSALDSVLMISTVNQCS